MKKRMMKLAALSMSALMTASLAACGGDKGGSGDDGGKAKGGDKEIVYWNIGTESPDKDVIAKAVDKFNAETESGYTVTVVPTQNDTYKEKLVVAMSSGECPDMYSCWSGGPMYEYIDSGFGQPIDELFNKSEIKDKLMESAVGQRISESGDAHLRPRHRQGRICSQTDQQRSTPDVPEHDRGLVQNLCAVLQ